MRTSLTVSNPEVTSHVSYENTSTAVIFDDDTPWPDYQRVAEIQLTQQGPSDKTNYVEHTFTVTEIDCRVSFIDAIEISAGVTEIVIPLNKAESSITL